MTNTYTVTASGWEIVYDSDGYTVHKGEEKYKFATYESAHFIYKLFNEQDNWLYYRNSTVKLSSEFNMAHSNIPKPNIRIFFGEGNPDTYFQFYLPSIPHKFQRWLTKKLLGITVQKI